MRRLLLLAALLAGPAASAQFHQNGTDPFGRWSTLGAEHYRVIYPEGLDSLARAYLLDLERWQPVVGRSAGMDPGSGHWGRLPVILHPYHPYSNGSVTWAPKRMDLYTQPEPYSAIPQSWMTQLTVHESRHVAQMQLAYRRPFRWVNVLVGEMWPGAITALFTPPTLLEGDAVVAETALTVSGRGRTAGFLSYYPVAFDNGDWRDWYQWVYGSFKHAGPDYYTVGYMTVAGMRYFYDRPMFTADYFNRVTRKPNPVASLQRYVRSISGKSFRKTFREIQEGFHAIWTEEADARAPFMPMEQVTRVPSYETDYTGGIWVDGVYFAFKEGKTTARRLIRLDPDGREHDLGAFASTSSEFSAGENGLYWSETLPGRRWTLDGKSVIRRMSLDRTRRYDLTAKGRLYNPQWGPTGITAIEYPVDGGTNLVVLSEEDGRIRKRYPAPEGIQLLESTWVGEDLYCLGLEDRGYGIWRRGESGWSCVLEPSVQQMVDLGYEDGCLEFTSDRNGVSEWYRFDPATGRAWQLTNSRYGGHGFSRNGDEIWFSSQTLQGMAIFKAAAPEPVEVDIRSVHRYPVAEKLSEQEKDFTPPEAPASLPDGPKRYVKPLHWVKFHSWAPIWFNYDDIASMSADLSYQTASPGLTGLFQNSLGTVWGTVGYSAHPDPGRAPEWRHSGHLQFTHAGLYPVLTGSFDIYDKGTDRYVFQKRTYDDHAAYSIVRRGLDKVSWTGRLTAYIPFRFHKGGIQQGLVPQVSWSISNDTFDNGTLLLHADGDLVSGTAHLSFLGYEPGRNWLMQTVRGSVRGYRMLQRAESQVYPRWGIGAETGASFRPGLTHIYSPVWYGYLYGYLPGLTRTQGLRLTAMGQYQLPTGAPFGENSVQMLPRGVTVSYGTAIARKSAGQLRLTADYAIPIYIGDISWFSPVAYVKNLLLIPHVDWMGFGGKRNGKGTPLTSSLVSAGADFTVELGNFLWAPFPCSVGVSASWIGGPYASTLAESAGKDWKPYSVELVFSLDI